jgi:transposase
LLRDRRRAEIIVLSVQALTQQRIAEQLGISRVAVNRWLGRFALHRLDGLTDCAGRGMPRLGAPEIAARSGVA